MPKTPRLKPANRIVRERNLDRFLPSNDRTVNRPVNLPVPAERRGNPLMEMLRTAGRNVMDNYNNNPFSMQRTDAPDVRGVPPGPEGRNLDFEQLENSGGRLYIPDGNGNLHEVAATGQQIKNFQQSGELPEGTENDIILDYNRTMSINDYRNNLNNLEARERMPVTLPASPMAEKMGVPTPRLAPPSPVPQGQGTSFNVTPTPQIRPRPAAPPNVAPVSPILARMGMAPPTSGVASPSPFAPVVPQPGEITESTLPPIGLQTPRINPARLQILQRLGLRR